MKIYNQDKTEELLNVDKTKGYLKEDKLFIAHHEAVAAVKDIGHYEVIKVYENGGEDVEWVVDIPGTEAKKAYDEYEDIYVYVPYTEEELQDRKRNRRKPLLEAFDKWEKAVLRGRETDDEVIMQWYKDLLDLKDSAFDTVPARIIYYL